MEGCSMPTIDVSHKDLCGLIGRKLSIEELRDDVMFAKTELDKVEGDVLKLDIKDTNRPDLWSAEGVAREIKARYSPGLPKYEVKKSDYVVNVDKSVEKVRPFTTCAVVKGLKIDENMLSQMIQLQEKVAGTFGSNRREVAIGVYDVGQLQFPITFKSVKDKDISFVPLEFKEKLHPKEILEKHPKGKEFGHLLKEDFPIFIDSVGEVLSMPPIINSDFSGKITEKTTDVFIECSGFDLRFLNTAINVLVAALAERGGTIYSVKVNYQKTSEVTPNLTPKKYTINVDSVNKMLGLTLKTEEILVLLKKSLYDAKQKGKKIDVLYPAYRQDIMHEDDVIEDVIISYGFNDIEPEELKTITKGGISKEIHIIDKLTEIMIGAGFQEIMSYTLTNVNDLYARMNTDGEAVEIEKPMSANWSVFRTSLIPGLMDIFSKNRHVEYPQSVFEIGNVVLADNSRETKARDVQKLAAACTGNVSYETISQRLDAFFRNIGIDYYLKKGRHDSFIEGRTAEIFVGKTSLGFIGEIHPSVLNSWDLENPVVAFEIDLEFIFKK